MLLCVLICFFLLYFLSFLKNQKSQKWYMYVTHAAVPGEVRGEGGGAGTEGRGCSGRD